MARTPAAETAENTATTSTPKTHPCKCLEGTGKQCPDITTRAFARGHDARMASRLATAVANGQTTEAAAVKLIREAGGSELLAEKMKHSAQLRKEKNSGAGKTTSSKDKKGETAGKSSDPEAAKTQPGTSPLGKKVTVKHAGEAGKQGKSYQAVIVRNAAADLVARHRLSGKDCDHEVEI